MNVKQTIAISYRSPLGRVASFDQYGAEMLRLEPGAEADAEWERATRSGATCYEHAIWLDMAASWSENKAPEGAREENEMSRKKNTNTTNSDVTTGTVENAPLDGAPPKPKTKRPRSGSWTPVTRQIPIPGTEDADGNALGAPIEFYRVEFAGETLEVLKNRAGVKQGNDWIKGIKARGEEGLKIDRLRREIEEMIPTASTSDVSIRLTRAALCLAGQFVTTCAEGEEPTA
jgi:hypothetical protein